MTTVTQWFENESPVNVGDYEWKPNSGLLWHWNGGQWGFYDDDGKYYRCQAKRPTWRGLAVKPKSGISSK